MRYFWLYYFSDNRNTYISRKNIIFYDVRSKYIIKYYVIVKNIIFYDVNVKYIIFYDVRDKYIVKYYAFAKYMTFDDDCAKNMVKILQENKIFQTKTAGPQDPSFNF